MSSLDPDVLGRILILNNLLHAATDEVWLGQVAAGSFATIPGVTTVGIYLDNSLVATAPDSLPVWPESWRPGAGSPPDDITIVAIRSARHSYGQLILQSHAIDSLAPYLPFIENATNTLALVIENLHQKRDLQTMTYELEQEVSRKVAEIRSKDSQFRVLTESTRAIPWELDLASLKFIYVGPQFSKIFGFPTEMLADFDSWRKIVHPDDRDYAVNYCNGMTRQGLDHDFIYRVVRGDGTIFWVNDIVTVVMGENGPERLLGYMIDITLQKQAEEQLKASEQYLRMAVEGGQVGLWEWNVASGHLEWNARLKEIFGLATDTEELTFERYSSAIHPEDVEQTLAAVEAALQGKTIFQHEYRIVWPDGSIRWIAATGQGNYSEDGKPEAMLGSGIDITDRKSAEERLRNSEQWHRTILQTAIGGIWTIDLHGNILETNDSYCAMSGYSDKELTTMKVADIEVLESEEALRRHTQEIKRTGEARFESQHRRKDGTIFDVEISAKYLSESDGRIVAMINDIGERKRAEEALRESEERWRAIIESEPECVKLLDHQGKVVFMNPAGLQMIQATLGDVRGKEASELVVQEDREGFEDMVDGVFRGETRHLVFDMVGLKGRRLTLETVSVPLWESQEKNHVKLLVGITRDITERKKLMEDHRRSAQLAALGTVAAGVAHEINNPIQGIINYATLIGNAPDKTERVIDMCGRIIKEGNRIASITKDLLHYAKDNRGEFRMTDIREPIKAATSLVSLNYKHSGVSIDLDLPTTPVLVMANPQWIQQIVVNLIENAFDAVQAKGEIRNIETIKVTGHAAGEGDSSRFRLEVLDNGIGIPAENLGKVRDAFFTTKQELKGTGLGLSIVGDIVSKHHGILDIESKEGQYTKVIVDLPVLTKD